MRYWDSDFSGSFLATGYPTSDKSTEPLHQVENPNPDSNPHKAEFHARVAGQAVLPEDMASRILTICQRQPEHREP